MENARTRDSILKQVFSSFRDIFIGSEDYSSGIPTMTDLKSSDWENISDDVKKELLIKSPERMKAIVSDFFTKVLPKRKRTAFASGTSVSKEQSGQKNNENKEISDDYQIGR